MNTHETLTIIGSGPAGLTAGIYAARANLKPLIFDGPKPGGQLMGTSTVDNWPGTPGILGPMLMQTMREHCLKLGCRFIEEEIETLNDTTQKPFSLTTKTGKSFSFDALIIATGATPKKLGCPGEDAYWAKGVSTCAVCDGAFYQGKKVVIVGGGDTAMEDASFMLRYSNTITIIQNEKRLTAAASMQERVVGKPGITIHYESTVTAFRGDGTKLTHVDIVHMPSKNTATLEADIVFLAIGLQPNSKPFSHHIETYPNGFIKTFDITKTSVEGIFVAGDVADYRYRQAITSAAAGCMAALDVERFLKK